MTRDALSDEIMQMNQFHRELREAYFNVEQASPRRYGPPMSAADPRSAPNLDVAWFPPAAEGEAQYTLNGQGDRIEQPSFGSGSTAAPQGEPAEQVPQEQLPQEQPSQEVPNDHRTSRI